MKIKLPDAETTEKIAGDLLHLLVNLRQRTKDWNDEGGCAHRSKLKSWQDKCDRYIEHLKQEFEIINNAE